jgi:serine kinase of HPr protein (carbohydrate metabolism regulator)
MPGIPTGNKQLQLARLDLEGTTDRGDSIQLSNTARVLVDMAGYLISEAQNNLNNDGTNTTGDLESSMSISDLDISGQLMSVDVLILDRYKFINDGVKGVEGGTGKYQFKTIRPTVEMVRNIKSWLRKRGARATKYKAISRTERKDKRIKKMKTEAESQTSLAWAVATSVKKKGIKPTKFFTKAVRATEKKFREEMAKGIKLDIIESFK